MPRAGFTRRLSVLVALLVCLACAQNAAAATSTIGGPGVGNGTFDVPGGDAVDSSGDLT